jgi:hypothetical protein
MAAQSSVTLKTKTHEEQLRGELSGRHLPSMFEALNSQHFFPPKKKPNKRFLELEIYKESLKNFDVLLGLK